MYPLTWASFPVYAWGASVVDQRLNNNRMAPEAGLEPATFRLTAGRSTIELLWNKAALLRPS